MLIGIMRACLSIFFVSRRGYSTPILREILKSNKTLMEQIDDDETIMEKEYTELKKAIGMSISHSHNSQQLLLIHPRVRWGSGSAPKNTTVELQVEEAQTLCQTIPGFSITRTIIVNTDYNVRKKMIWGMGRLEAIREYKQQHNISALMINVDILSPLQQRELGNYFGIPIYDRYNIVLNIFKLFAKTKEAKLQIALAEIPYIRSRLKFLHKRNNTPLESLQLSSFLSSRKTNLDSCNNLEVLRIREQKIRKQIHMVMDLSKKEMIQAKKEKNLPTKIPVIGVIGYTNAGKTTLIKKLTDSHTLFGENRLFATLDTTIHKAILPSHRPVIFVDTIGFISNLPVKLFVSFSATLQHIETADLLIHVMNLSHPDLLAQRDNVLETLRNLKIKQTLVENMITVGNKLDKCSQAMKERLMEMSILPSIERNEQIPESLYPISCRTNEGMSMLIKKFDKVVQQLSGSRLRRLQLAPDSKAIPYLYNEGFVYTSPISTGGGNYLLFDVFMNNEEFARFQSTVEARFKLKE